MAAGLLVSFTANAEQEVLIGFSRAAVTLPAAPSDLIPAESPPQGASFQLPRMGGAAINLASLVLGAPEDLESVPDEDSPHLALKRKAGNFPAVNRGRKGNPFIGLRPSFETRLTKPAAVEAVRRFEALFSEHDRDPAPTVFIPSAGSPPGPEAVASFMGGIVDETTTGAAPGMSSPMSAAAGLTVQTTATAVVARTNDGATPAVQRAVGMSSTTPLPRAPLEVDAMLRLPGQAPGIKGRPGAPNFSIVARSDGIIEQPDYMSLISAVNFRNEQQCLAQAIYFEARSEPPAGQAAVAQVVLNRVASGLYPTTICGVVYQNARHYMGCQFSFACEGKSLRITEPAPWAQAQRVAREVTEGETYMAHVGGATHYHAKYVTPPWARQLTKMDVIGQHIFYKLKPGQT